MKVSKIEREYSIPPVVQEVIEWFGGRTNKDSKPAYIAVVIGHSDGSISWNSGGFVSGGVIAGLDVVKSDAVEVWRQA